MKLWVGLLLRDGKEVRGQGYQRVPIELTYKEELSKNWDRTVDFKPALSYWGEITYAKLFREPYGEEYLMDPGIVNIHPVYAAYFGVTFRLMMTMRYDVYTVTNK